MATRILTAIDEPEARRVIAVIAYPMGCELLAPTDGNDAMTRLADESFDGAIFDEEGRGIDAIALARAVRRSKLNNRIPVALLVKVDDLTTLRRGYKAGATWILSKPPQPGPLRAFLQVVTGHLPVDRRRSFRLPLRTTVECLEARDINRPLVLPSLEISMSGVLLEVSGGLSVGQEVWLRLPMPGRVRPLELMAKVVRKEASGRTALDFVPLRPQDSDALREYLMGEEKSST